MTTIRLLTQRLVGSQYAAASYRLPAQSHLTSTFWVNNKNHTIWNSPTVNLPARCHFTLIGSGGQRQQDNRCTSGDHGRHAVTTPQLLLNSLHHGFHSRFAFGTKSSPDQAGKSESKAASAAAAEYDIFAETSKLGLFAKFKLMYTKYWYVTVPVHCLTSCFWFGGFYYLSKSGVDVPSMLQYLHISEALIEKVRHSDMGHLAVAYLCYKVATPLRYAVTLGGTTVSIKYLVQAGHIKPMPSKMQLMQMYEQKKADRAAAKVEAEKTRQDESRNK